jgi:hypothetical protein
VTVSICSLPVRPIGDHSQKQEAMKHMLLIHQGTTPTSPSDEWQSLSEADRMVGAIEVRPIVEW